MSELNISSARYIDNLFTGGKDVLAVIDDVEWTIPQQEGNRHWAAVQEWVAEGNTIEE